MTWLFHVNLSQGSSEQNRMYLTAILQFGIRGIQENVPILSTIAHCTVKLVMPTSGLWRSSCGKQFRNRSCHLSALAQFAFPNPWGLAVSRERPQKSRHTGAAAIAAVEATLSLSSLMEDMK